MDVRLSRSGSRSRFRPRAPPSHPIPSHTIPSRGPSPRKSLPLTHTPTLHTTLSHPRTAFPGFSLPSQREAPCVPCYRQSFFALFPPLNFSLHLVTLFQGHEGRIGIQLSICLYHSLPTYLPYSVHFSPPQLSSPDCKLNPRLIHLRPGMLSSAPLAILVRIHD